MTSDAPVKNQIYALPPCPAFAGEYACIGTGERTTSVVIPVTDLETRPDFSMWSHHTTIYIDYLLQMKPDSPVIGHEPPLGIFMPMEERENAFYREWFDGRFLIPTDAEFLRARMILTATSGSIPNFLGCSLMTLRQRALFLSDKFLASADRAALAWTKAIRGG